MNLNSAGDIERTVVSLEFVVSIGIIVRIVGLIEYVEISLSPLTL